MADTLATEETTELIATTKVEGTAVYNRAGDRLGTIQNFMVGKRSGKVDYAVLEFGGLFGIGSDHYPLPWNLLDYDTRMGGYVVDIDKSLLQDAPHYSKDNQPTHDEHYGRQVHGYWDIPYPAL